MQNTASGNAVSGYRKGWSLRHADAGLNSSADGREGLPTAAVASVAIVESVRTARALRLTILQNGLLAPRLVLW